MAGHPALSPRIRMPAGPDYLSASWPQAHPGKVGIHQVLKSLDGHTITPLPSADVWSQPSCPHSPEQGLRGTFGHTETSCLSGHSFHLSEPGQYLKQMSEAKVVGFAPAQLPGLISILGQHLTSRGPAINARGDVLKSPPLGRDPSLSLKSGWGGTLTSVPNFPCLCLPFFLHVSLTF